MIACMALARQQIPPTVGLATVNPLVTDAMRGTGLKVAPEGGLLAWPRGRASAAGVSSFGYSGTNVHLIVRKADPASSPEPRRTDGRGALFISARSKSALRALLVRYMRFFETTETPFPLICRAAAARRTHMRTRVAIVASSVSDARAHIEAILAQDCASARIIRRPAAGSALRALNDAIEAAGDDQAARLAAVAELFLAGGTDAPGLVGGEGPVPHVALPIYPFAHKHHWFAPPAGRLPAQLEQERADDAERLAAYSRLLRASEMHAFLVPSATTSEFTVRIAPDSEAQTFLQGHAVDGVGPMLPLCTSLEWATSAASIWRAEGGAQWTVLSDVSALEPLAWPPASPLIVRQAGKGNASVRVHIGTLHGESAAVLADVAFSSTGPTEIGDAPRLPAVDDEAVASAQRIYADVTRRGLVLSGDFSRIHAVHRADTGSSEREPSTEMPTFRSRPFTRPCSTP